MEIKTDDEARVFMRRFLRKFGMRGEDMADWMDDLQDSLMASFGMPEEFIVSPENKKLVVESISETLSKVTFDPGALREPNDK